MTRHMSPPLFLQPSHFFANDGTAENRMHLKKKDAEDIAVCRWVFPNDYYSMTFVAGEVSSKLISSQVELLLITQACVFIQDFYATHLSTLQPVADLCASRPATL